MHLDADRESREPPTFSFTYGQKNAVHCRVYPDAQSHAHDKTLNLPLLLLKDAGNGYVLTMHQILIVYLCKSGSFKI